MSDTMRDKKPDAAPRIVEAKFVAGVPPGAPVPPPVLAEIAFAGRSNVGKSSLINSLVERNGLVRTSSKPGSTRQLNFYEARAADTSVLGLVDLPGYGFTHRSKSETKQWRELIEGYLGQRVTLGAVVLLVDIRRGAEDEDIELLAFITATRGHVHEGRRVVQPIVVATKMDKLSMANRRPALTAVTKGLKEALGKRAEGLVPTPRVVGFSAETHEGRDELWSVLRRAVL